MIEEVNKLADPELKKELATRAFQLAERAEAIENSMQDPAIIEMNIRRYQHMLAGGLSNEVHRKIVEEMLADAQTLLEMEAAEPAPGGLHFLDGNRSSRPSGQSVPSRRSNSRLETP